mmetsp:Transcript_21943/g.25364  ORF Transcript_21943/g.25364 Transcript_21943/m.25364 type:complete len:119 (-) Transcript_21943:1880-2236(-)
MKRAAFDSEKSQPDDDAEEAEPKRESQRSSNTISIFDDSDDEESENSSEDDSGDTAGRINSREQLIIDKNEAIREFKKVIKKWSSYTPDWKACSRRRNSHIMNKKMEQKFATQTHLLS